MKIKELFERTSFKDFDDIIEYAINACRPALSVLPTPLYRGMWGVDTHDKIISSGKRGVGLSNDELYITPEYTKHFDEYTQTKFGYPYLTKGIFTSGSKTHAKEYGELYTVLPIGQFKYIWSPKVEDQVEISNDLRLAKNYTQQQFAEYVDRFNYTDKNITQAIKTDHEIILHCDRYFHFSLDNIKTWGSDYTSLEELWGDLRG
jgi:hypothetical protein